MRAPALTACLLALAGPAAAQAAAPGPDSVAASRDRYARQVLASIAGRETLPADSVFRNIRVLKGVPAGRLVRMMDLGYGRSLGVSCDHCHDTDEWDSDEKRPKEIARQMMGMVRTINGELLPKIANLESERPTVNCTTCHRGDTKPALDLD
ncbi:MAG TPA: c-type cytochrome [Gemmatimonadales bacterium]|nr:c-type cytochrome [Gemmatimonadales bacterium]